MGVGYFGLEAFFSWYLNKETRDGSIRSMLRRRKQNPLHEQVKRHIQHIGSLLSFNGAKAWLSRCWAFPIVYHDILFGVVVAVMPSVRDKENTKSGIVPNASTTGGLMIKARAAPKETEQEGDFLTLPPQLHARLPPKTPKPQAKKERYLEMLLHNISHTDLVLGLDVLSANDADAQSSSLKSMCLSRPRFSAFDM